MPKVIYILQNGERREIEAQPGESLMQLAVNNGLDVEGACGGVMACSTCHVIVDKDWYGKLPPPTDDETDMLDLAPGLTRTSRLGCQDSDDGCAGWVDGPIAENDEKLVGIKA